MYVFTHKKCVASDKEKRANNKAQDDYRLRTIKVEISITHTARQESE